MVSYGSFWFTMSKHGKVYRRMNLVDLKNQQNSSVIIFLVMGVYFTSVKLITVIRTNNREGRIIVLGFAEPKFSNSENLFAPRDIEKNVI